MKRLSGDGAVVHARMTLEGQAPVAGVETPGTRTRVPSFVVHRVAGGWRCASAHDTDVVPGMETSVVDDEGRLRPVNSRPDPTG